MHTPRHRLPGEVSFLLMLLAFSCFMLWASYKISRFVSVSSAGVFPMLCAATMCVTGLLSLRKSTLSRPDQTDGESLGAQFVRKLAPPTLVFFTLLIVAYMLLLEKLGFVLSSYLFLLLSMRVLGSTRTMVNVLSSAAVLAAIYVIFQTAFSVVLPSGSLLAPFLPEFLK